ANLIKKYKPRYNILLKDDKRSPYIKIDLKEKFPTVEITRKVKRDGARYFGPFFAGIRAKDLVEVIRSAYKMRTCAKKLAKRDRPCLNYDIGLCYAPCKGYIDEVEYGKVVKKVLKFLSGYDDEAVKIITNKMERAVENEQFERAIEYRDQLKMLSALRERTVANLGSVTDVDAIAYAGDESGGVFSVCVVRGNKMLGVKNYPVSVTDESESERFSSFLAQYYAEQSVLPQEICLPVGVEVKVFEEYLSTLSAEKIVVTYPQKATRKRLLDTAQTNAGDYLIKYGDKERREYASSEGACVKLAQILGIKSAWRIECYDISHISGVDKVASQSVFIGGVKAKDEYRKYKIKTVDGNDDFACMEEVIRRRLTRAKDGDGKFSDLPDLILIDGGKGQLARAKKAMDELGFNIDMVSLAERNEEIYTLNSDNPLVLLKSDPALKLLIRVRDEAHRFAVSYHRKARSNRYFSELEKIEGVGKTRRAILIKAFENIEQIRNASEEILRSVKGIDAKTAHNVYAYFHKGE
ncbi:MAG: excinuclease ABC subunit UvrC, partial [Clostridia bacterium]|nr:excinuclease ABC subunit UvrC [Clostridia bacterium]